MRSMMNEITADLPAPAGIDFMEPESWEITKQIALDGKVISKPASDDSYRTDIAEAAVEERRRRRRRQRRGLAGGGSRSHGGRRLRPTAPATQCRRREIRHEFRSDQGRSSDRRGGRRLRRGRVRRERADLPHRRVARSGSGPRIDASGKYVLPGGIDPHTHLDMPFGGTVTVDDVESGQTAAAFGGTTCHVDFVIQPQGETFAAALDMWKEKANGKQVIDMGYHMAITDSNDGGSLEEPRRAPRAGRDVLQALHGVQGRAHGRRRDALPVDAGRGRLGRARDGPRRERRRDRRARQGCACGRPYRAALARADPPAGDRGRVRTAAIQLARVAGAPLYVVHVSCREAVEPIALAREKG